MQTSAGLLTYCSNIHTGEDWQHHFAVLQKSIPVIKQQVSPQNAFGIGLRLANQASIDLSEKENLDKLKTWLTQNNCYVFTMNGFPYGGFHNTVVKDQVHAPDWTTQDRVAYTIRMFRILAEILPDDLSEGGISTSPLSYRFWWKTSKDLQEATLLATQNMLVVLDELVAIKKTTGKSLHLDIEPEPDGILENSPEFITWYQEVLLPLGIQHFAQKGIDEALAKTYIYEHIQLCYDVCHFAVSYEEPAEVIQKLEELGIKVGKIQISSALKVDFSDNPTEKLAAIARYDEPSYLHQVVARKADNTFVKYPDLGEALLAALSVQFAEWRVHFHVPLFIEHYGLLSSTRQEIEKILAIQKLKPFTAQLEIETYTWGVLPADYQYPLDESIIREIAWVKSIL